jgi:hypothetical protein
MMVVGYISAHVMNPGSELALLFPLAHEKIIGGDFVI